MRTAVDWRSSSRDNYRIFCKKHPSIKLTYDEWRNIIYTFSESFRNYILETGEKAKLPYGFGDFSINKKKRKRLVGIKDEFVNLAIDWKRSKEKGKRIYNFNYHTEGFFFGWMWFKENVRLKNCDLWYFKPSRTTSRLLAHYIKADNKYQHLYNEWKK
jgi:hypothetical protein